MSQTSATQPAPHLDEWANQAVTHFQRRLRFETDVSDVHEAMHSGDPGFVLVDSRGQDAWDQGHLPGALHLPRRKIAERATALIPPGTPVVTYCWARAATARPRPPSSSRGSAMRSGRCWAAMSTGSVKALRYRPGPVW